MKHPFQSLSSDTFNWLMRWSRILFWVVLGLYAYIKFTSMPSAQTPESILDTPVEQLPELGFWAGYDYLFMLSYFLFFAVCCVWGAKHFAHQSFMHQLGVWLAWAMVLLLGIDMLENWMIWQVARENKTDFVCRGLVAIKWPKEVLFTAGAAYALGATIWIRWKHLKISTT